MYSFIDKTQENFTNEQNYIDYDVNFNKTKNKECLTIKFMKNSFRF